MKVLAWSFYAFIVVLLADIVLLPFSLWGAEKGQWFVYVATLLACLLILDLLENLHLRGAEKTNNEVSLGYGVIFSLTRKADTPNAMIVVWSMVWIVVTIMLAKIFYSKIAYLLGLSGKPDPFLVCMLDSVAIYIWGKTAAKRIRQRRMNRQNDRD